jgi:hypothetical protein
MNKILSTLLLFGMCLFVGGCINPLPGSVDAVASDPAAVALLAEAAQAHGGDERFARVQRIDVAYDGEWLGRVWRFQPVLVDRGYRKSSAETIWYSEHRPIVAQIHTGPEGTKQVLWPAHKIEIAGDDGVSKLEVPIDGGASVLYDGSPTKDAEQRALQEEAAAMVAEAYRMFLTAPFYFTQRAGRGDDGDGSMIAVMSEPDEVNGVMCDQVLIELRPGFGKSEVDRVQVAIARDTGMVRRVRFSLDGFSRTRGATADVELSGFVEFGGLTLPTEFLEIVTFPLNREVHRWQALDLKLQFDSPTEQSEWTR